MKKILVIGKGGQVSENLLELLRAKNEFDFLAVGQSELDLSQPEKIYNQLSAINYKPDIIINAAAYTAVDTAEDERDLCNNINNISVREIAKFATKNQALLVHYSTDYVLDGSGTAEFLEDNTTNLNPLNFYGKTKLDGEREIIKSGCEYLILRTSWVYNHAGKNFVLTMLKLAAEKEELRVIDDQVGSPTYAFDIANVTLQMLPKFKKSGIYNFVSPDKISWCGFAGMIMDVAYKNGFAVKVNKIAPIATSEYPTKAARPLNSRLSVAKLRKDYGLQLPFLQESLTNCLKRIKDSN